MEIHNISHAKAQLSALIARVEQGEEIIIGRADKPIARLVPYRGHNRQPFLGLRAGHIQIPSLEAFNAWDEATAIAMGLKEADSMETALL